MTKSVNYRGTILRKLELVPLRTGRTGQDTKHRFCISAVVVVEMLNIAHANLTTDVAVKFERH